jgi:phage terminase large subunit GpA-like protein
LQEIADCLSVDSPVREVSVLKGAQLGFTVGVLENAIGYYIAHVRHAPVMLITADADLAQHRLEQHILPMLAESGLDDMIASSDARNPRKTGRTVRRLEWIGGGFLVPFGAQNANKLRSIPIQFLLRDEIDGWPEVIGKDGDPLKLSADRTAAYEDTRKILDLSTPSIVGQSKIAQRFEAGDRRRYFVRCLRCEHPQTLRWKRTNPETGEVTGMTWEIDAHGHLMSGSTRYLCEQCAHPHLNDDKSRLLAPENGAEWRPTAEPADPAHRSYHLSALYSPVGMQSWDACVRKWLASWDEERGVPRDMPALQVFYNNVLAEPFELRGERVRFDAVSDHRRSAYQFGTVPNRFAAEHCSGPVMLLTCAVDVHSDDLAVAVFGWAPHRRAILIDYWRFEGDTEQLDNPATWGRLRDLIESRSYTADDGKRYRITVTLIDSGYRADHVYQFAAEYSSGVFPVKGREAPGKTAAIREFAPFTTPNGVQAWTIVVDLYKDRWSAALRRSWDGQSQQPIGHFNAPADVTEAQLKELTVEMKRERIDSRTKQRIGWEWRRPSGAANELWDLLVYANAALDLAAWDVCRNQWELEAVDWAAFHDAAKNGLYFEERTA